MARSESSPLKTVNRALSARGVYTIRPVAPNLDLWAAQALLLSRLSPLQRETVPIADAAGRYLAVEASAAHDLPPYDNSAMDGFAVRVADGCAPRPLAGRISAGDDPPALPARCAMGIATGAALPDGADAVVPIEVAFEADGQMRCADQPLAEQNIRRAGADVRRGELVLGAGACLTPLALSGIATSGCAFVECVRVPRVAILVTGDELKPPGERLARGQIHESNSLLIGARMRALGCEVVDVVRVPDNADATRDAFAHGFAIADVVVSSGGVSVGPRDHVKPALATLGVDELFWRVAVQPGRPVFAGLAGNQLVMGLPGNPLSVLVGLELLLRPALACLAGAQNPVPLRRTSTLIGTLRPLSDRTRALPAELQRDGVKPLRANQSHQVARAAAADCLVIVPPGSDELEDGASVEVVTV